METANMTEINALDIFTRETLDDIFPHTRCDSFFEALYGDASEGAYDISLEFSRMEKETLVFEFHLKQRPGKCLSCSITYGLPEVFSRHPVIDLQGITEKVNTLLGEAASCKGWKMGVTKKINNHLYVVPLFFQLK